MNLNTQKESIKIIPIYFFAPIKAITAAGQIIP